MSIIAFVSFVSASIKVPMIVSYGESMYSLFLQIDVQNVMDKKIENRIKIDLESIFNICDG